MCNSASLTRSSFSDADFCFIGSVDLRLYTCWCPFSSCVADAVTGANPRCEFTLLTTLLGSLFAVLIVAALATYLMATHSLSDLQMQQHKQGAHRFRDVLFGVYHASTNGAVSGDDLHGVNEKVQESTQLLSVTQRSGKGGSGGGTFDTQKPPLERETV